MDLNVPTLSPLLADNGKIDGTFQSYAGAYIGGAVAGAVAPVISVAAGGSVSAVIGLNVVQRSATNAIEQYIGTGKVDMKQVLQSGAMEGITAGLMPSGSSKSVNSIADSLDKMWIT